MCAAEVYDSYCRKGEGRGVIAKGKRAALHKKSRIALTEPSRFTRLARIRKEQGNNDEALRLLLDAKSMLADELEFDQFLCSRIPRERVPFEKKKVLIYNVNHNV